MSNRNPDSQCHKRPHHVWAGIRVPHPGILIFIWSCLTLVLQMLVGYPLLLLSAILIGIAAGLSTSRFIALLRRTRWILLSIFIIYAYTSHGSLLWESLGMVSPVTDGLQNGAIQLLRLISTLAGLAILLNVLSQSQLVAGLYTLSYPLTFFGILRERFAVRLALTLRYADTAIMVRNSGWHAAVEQLLLQQNEMKTWPDEKEIIELETVPLTIFDGLIVIAVLLAMSGVWL